MRNRRCQNVIRIILGSLFVLAALNAFGGGYYGMSGAKGIPLEWLQGSPFSDYFIPSLILFCIVGGSFLFAAVSIFAGRSYGTQASLAALTIVSIWLVVQLSIIGYVSWMQPVTAIVALVILIMTLMLKHNRKST